MGMFDFLGPTTTSPGTYPAMEARRRIALQLLANSKKGYPKTIGEGLTAIGDAIGDRSVLNQLAAQEAAYGKAAGADAASSIPAEAITPGPQSAAPPPPPAAAATAAPLSYAPADDSAAPAVTPYPATPVAPAAATVPTALTPDETNAGVVPADTNVNAGVSPADMTAAQNTIRRDQILSAIQARNNTLRNPNIPSLLAPNPLNPQGGNLGATGNAGVADRLAPDGSVLPPSASPGTIVQPPPPPPPAPPPAPAPGPQSSAGVPPALSKLVMSKEWYTPTPKKDYSTTSIGYGTNANGRGYISEPDARAEMNSQLADHLKQIDSKFPNLSPDVRNSVASLTYNVGPGWMSQDGNQLAAALKAGDMGAAKNAFMKYVHVTNPDGSKSVLPGLVNRRTDEARAFDGQQPTYTPNPDAPQASRAVQPPGQQSSLQPTPQALGFSGEPAAPPVADSGTGDARDAIARALMGGRTAPQPSPMQTAATPFSGLPPAPSASSGGLPPEITGGTSIKPAPQALPIQPAPQPPQQIAQNGSPPPPTPQRLAPQPRQPLPQDEPMTEDEKRGWRRRTQGVAMQDPIIMKEGQDLIDYGAKQRDQIYQAKLKDWNDQMLANRQRQMAEEQFAREAPERNARLAQQKQALEQSALTPAAPGVPGVPGAGYDPRLGTPQSPQRTGVPAAPPVPPGISPAQHAAQQAPILTQAVQAEQKATPEFNRSIALVKALGNHPGREYGLGSTGKIAGQIPGTEAFAFHQMLDQLKGKEFLQAYQTLKGGGSITEVEGEKATQALARINASQSKGEFDAALADLEKTMRGDLELAQRKVNRPVSAWRGANDNSSVAPDIGERRGTMEYIGGNPADKMSWRKIQ